MAEIQSGAGVNEPSGKSVRTRSKFPLNYNFYGTYRFGHYMPHYVENGVDSDEIHMRSGHDVRSFNLKAPLLEDVALKKDYFAVPMTAILPLNWDKFYTNPVVGEDVPNDVGPSAFGFYNLLATVCGRWFSSVKSIVGSSSSTAPQVVTAVFRYLLFIEQFYSTGSLIAYLGIHGHRYFSCTDADSTSVDHIKTLDWCIDFIVGELNRHVHHVVVLDPNQQSHTFYMGTSDQHLDTRDFLEFMRDNLASTVSDVSFSNSDLSSLKSDFNNHLWNHVFTVPSKDVFNLSRVAAYQLIVHHFYSNDNIDYVFDANLYRQLMWYYFESNFTDAERRFTVNGMTYLYDSLSGHVLYRQVNLLTNLLNGNVIVYGSSATVIRFLSYWSALFGFKRSLRFKDYFTGGHSQPLAVGDVNVYVNTAGNSVSVVDVTRNIQKQRFLNAVNRVGRRFSDYMKELFGKDIAPDYTQPFYLAHTSDVIYGSEVENTSEAMTTDAQTTRSNFRSNGSRYEFTYYPDRDCIVIGMTYFDIARAYISTIDRQTLHLNRYDWFNPFMQFVGDQEVYAAELGSVVGATAAANPDFAYQLRHMEYKQRTHQAAGGFVEQLPGWCFIADDKYRDVLHISPDYIRSRPTELDKFFNTLTGYSLGNYFHFVVKNKNDVSASRPMAYAPTIL